MKRFKQPKQPRISLSAKDIEKLKRDITTEATRKALLIFLEAAKDEFDLTFEQCRSVYTRADRYCQYLDEHLASIKQLAEDLYKDTGVDMRWR